MKLKHLVIGCISASTLLGCSKKSEYKTAIDNNLKDHHECIARVNTSGMELKKGYLEAYQAKYAYVIALKSKDKLSAHELDAKVKLDALVDAGLLTMSSEEVAVKGWFDIRSDYNLYLYNYTNKAHEYLQSDKLGDAGPDTKILCYANMKVDKILNYVEQVNNPNQVQVKYSYDYADVAGWSKNEKMRKAFPTIEKTLNKQDKTSTVTLIKTDNGWQTSL